MDGSIARSGEDRLIARYFAPMAGPAGLALKDDAALLTPPAGTDLVVTVDTVVASVHFFADDPADAIAEKALGVNLSDLAAKGATPLGFVMALSLPDNWQEDWLAQFADGLARAASKGACPLLGGDTTRSAGPLSISITVFGSVPTGTMVRRTTAKPGDLIAVSGTIGDAALGLKIRSAPEREWAGGLSEKDYSHLLGRYLRPQPRLVLAEALRRHASASMDVSDGLIGDCNKLLQASGVTGRLQIETVPLSAAAHVAIGFNPGLLADAVTGGDDYEILLTIPPERLEDMIKDARAAGCPITVIGAVETGDHPLTVTLRGERFLTRAGSFSHF